MEKTVKSLIICALGCLALSACGPSTVPAPTPESDSSQAARSAPNGAAPQASTDPRANASTAVETGGGVAGQTPPYGQPGGAPNQVTSSGDGAGPSVGEDTPPR